MSQIRDTRLVSVNNVVELLHCLFLSYIECIRERFCDFCLALISHPLPGAFSSDRLRISAQNLCVDSWLMKI